MEEVALVPMDANALLNGLALLAKKLFAILDVQTEVSANLLEFVIVPIRSDGRAQLATLEFAQFHV